MAEQPVERTEETAVGVEQQSAETGTPVVTEPEGSDAASTSPEPEQGTPVELPILTPEQTTKHINVIHSRLDAVFFHLNDKFTAMFKKQDEICASLAETNKSIAEAKAETNKSIAEAKAETNKSIAEAKAETNKNIAEARDETNKKFSEILKAQETMSVAVTTLTTDVQNIKISQESLSKTVDDLTARVDNLSVDVDQKLAQHGRQLNQKLTERMEKECRAIREKENALEKTVAERFVNEKVALGKTINHQFEQEKKKIREEMSRIEASVITAVSGDTDTSQITSLTQQVETITKEVSEMRSALKSAQTEQVVITKEVSDIRSALQSAQTEQVAHGTPQATNIAETPRVQECVSGPRSTASAVRERSFASGYAEQSFIHSRQFQCFTADKKSVHPVVFVKSFEDVLPNYWTDKEKIKYICSFIQGHASLWAGDVSKSCNTVEEFERRFLEKYWSTSIQERLRREVFHPETFDYRKGNLRTYFERYIDKTRYWTRPIEDQDLLKILKAHLPDDIQEKLVNVPDTHLESFLVVLDSLDIIHENRKRKNTTGKRSTESSGDESSNGRSNTQNMQGDRPVKRQKGSPRRYDRRFYQQNQTQGTTPRSSTQPPGTTQQNRGGRGPNVLTTEVEIHPHPDGNGQAEN